MSARFLLIDLESVQPVPDDVGAWLADAGSAWVFHGPHQTKLLPRYSALGERVTLVPISKPGKNSLDFHLVFYLGYLTARNPNAKFAVLSQDTGYDPAIAHALTLAFDLLRIENLDPVTASATQPGNVAKKSAAKKNAAPKPLVTAKRKAISAKKAGPTTKAAAVVKKVLLKKVITSSKSVGRVKQPCPTGAKKASERTVAAIYGDVRQGLQERVANRPRSREALERHVQTMMGVESSLDKVRAVVDRLFTVDAVRQEGRRLVYFASDSIPAPSADKAP